MDNKTLDLMKVDYERWKGMMYKAQIVIALTIFVLELSNDIYLYLNLWKPLGHDTVVMNFLRYLVLTTLINFGSILISHMVMYRIKLDNPLQKYILSMPIIIACIDVSYSHYQFAVVLPVFIVPIILTVVYEDKKFTVISTIMGALGALPGILARAKDPDFNYAIVPEASIAVSFILMFGIMSIIIIDILLEREKNLKEALDNANRASDAKGDFISNMSHEIRTPMNAIVGMCELIQREEMLSDNVKEYTTNIQSAGRHLLSIINDILDFSKIDSGKMELVEESFNISSTLNDVINMSMVRKGKKPVELIVSADPEIPKGLIGDEARIRQIMINLVTNAIKYTERGTVILKVSFSRQNYGINLNVSVKDTGIGITPENIEKLFDSFQQVDTKRNRSVEGTGLGLVISKRLITRMGGFINVESTYGEGSEFRFVIPLRVSDPEPYINIKEKEKVHAVCYISMTKFKDEEIALGYKGLIDDLMEELTVDTSYYSSFNMLESRIAAGNVTHCFIGKEEYLAHRKYFDECSEEFEVVVIQERYSAIALPDTIKCVYKPFYILSIVAVLNDESVATNHNERRIIATRFTAPKARVLIVDDNSVNLKVAVGLLRPYGMQVITAESGAEAIRLLKAKNFDLVFMDHMMPEMDGVETTQRIRAMEDEYYKTLPIVALTANVFNGVREMFKELGFQDYIAKPIEMAVMNRVLSHYIPRGLQRPVHEDDADCKVEKQPKPKKIETKKIIDGEIDTETGLNYTDGDMESYIEVVRSFIDIFEGKSERISSLYEEEDWTNYTIEVHALKSSALFIGAVGLSELAKELESSGKEGNIENIKEKHSDLMELYKKVYDEALSVIKAYEAEAPKEKALEVKEIVKEPETKESEEITAEELKDILWAAKDSARNFDADAIDELYEKSKGKTVDGKEVCSYLKEIKDRVDDFEYEDAVNVADELMNKILGVN